MKSHSQPQLTGIKSRDLSDLENPFTEEEVWQVIKELPSDKSPEPDEMTAAFYQATWPVIKHDLMQAVHAFYAIDRQGFTCVNGTLLTLIPKKVEAQRSGDYSPSV